VVDVGLASVPDPSRTSGGRMVGDADAASLDGWASALTPVPGGVGPVTVAQLMWNTAKAVEMLAGGEPTV
jgi:5,10-methylene-tetrahydrofolate dehydrogenase/methenyl tetrahydrofolate cyclohydrolase